MTVVITVLTFTGVLDTPLLKTIQRVEETPHKTENQIIYVALALEIMEHSYMVSGFRLDCMAYTAEYSYMIRTEITHWCDFE